MDTHQQNPDTASLYAYLDGELDGTNEEVLFRTLADDVDLRAEMQDQLAIRKAIQHDAEAFTPPAAATSALFASLGFTIPAAAAGTTATGSILGKAGLALGSALLTTVVIVLFQMFTQPDLPNSPLPTSAPAPIQLAPPPQQPPQTIVRTIVVPAPASTPSAATAITEADVRERDSDMVPAFAAPPVERSSVNPKHLASAPTAGQVYEARQLDNPPTQMTPHYWTPTGFSLQMRGISAKSNPAPTIISQSDPVLANFNLGLFYEPDEYQAVGVEVGHEAFSQHFTGREDGELVRYEQNPMAYWVSMAYQVTSGDVYEGVSPYAQVQAGGVLQLGPMARLTLGLKISPFERMSFLVGAEGTLLFYRHQQNWFNTQKLGLTYGMLYQF